VERTPLMQALQELELNKPSTQRRNTITLNISKPSTPVIHNERLSTLQNEKFTVVDRSSARQGVS
jgi:hypothetical protein